MTPFSAPLPLRLSSAWGAFRTVKPIPHRYGECAGSLLQYNDSRTQFVWADHAVEGIDMITANGQPVGEWEWSNAVDVTGHAIALVTFGQPQDEGTDLIGRGRGKRHPADGRRLTNPADVIEDVLALAGRIVDLSRFRRACERDEIRIGGSLESAPSVQSVVRDICASVGAVFCPSAREISWIWPGDGGGQSSRWVVRDGAVSCSASIEDLANDLTIEYAHVSDQPQATLHMDAPDSVARYGRRATTLSAPWLRSARAASFVARRWLQLHARPIWLVSVATSREINVGDTINLAHPLIAASGDHVVLGRDRDLDTGESMLKVRAPAGATPAVRLVDQASAFAPPQYANAAVETIGTERVLTLRETNGAPITGAVVNLDGRIKRTTDSGGRVTFPVESMPPGEHVLDIQTADGRSLSTTVLIA